MAQKYKVSDDPYSIVEHNSAISFVSGGFALGGLDLGARMTVIRLRSGKVVLHSPVNLTVQITDFLAKKGEVAYVIAPNSYHHLFVKPYLDAYKAEFWTVDDVVKKRHDLPLARSLEGEWANAGFKDDFDIEIVRGKRLTEAVFLHKDTQTLIVTDLGFSLKAPSNRLKAFVQRKMGVLEPFGVSALGKYHFIAGAESARQSIAKIASWSFSSIIMSHGEVVTKDARQTFREGFAHYL